MRVAEDPEIVRWIEFPNSLLLFAMVLDNLRRGRQGRPLRIPGYPNLCIPVSTDRILVCLFARAAIAFAPSACRDDAVQVRRP
jgi:hypothetical protein